MLHCQLTETSFNSFYIMDDMMENTTMRIPVAELHPLDESYMSKHAFSEHASWLIPGVVLLGMYPFLDPYRYTSQVKAEEHLTRILDAGITTFVCLQEELPPQDSMTSAGYAGFLPYKPSVETIFAEQASRRPITASDHSAEATAAPTANPPGSSQGLLFLHYPIRDFGLPTMEQMTGIVQALKSQIAAGRKLYMHCWGGRGRSGLVGACLLAALYNLSADDALARVQRSFDARRGVTGQKSPETAAQVLFVHEFVANLTAESDAT